MVYGHLKNSVVDGISGSQDNPIQNQLKRGIKDKTRDKTRQKMALDNLFIFKRLPNILYF